MKIKERIIAALLLLCMVLGMAPPIQLVRAADEADVYYVLDTDGIDAGKQYLIVTGTSSFENAMATNGSATSSGVAPTKYSVGVVDGTRIESGFTGEASCLMSFNITSKDGNTFSCTMTSGGAYLQIKSSGVTFTTGPNNYTPLEVYHIGDGAYRIYRNNNGKLNYIYYNSKQSKPWQRTNANDLNSMSFDALYFFERVEPNTGFSVLYDGNGSTKGEVPDEVTGLEKGSEHIVLAPKTELIREEPNGDTYLFNGWSTTADGSIDRYQAGDRITVTQDTILYAQWLLQIKYAVTVINYVDGIPQDVAPGVSLYVANSEGDNQLLLLTKVEEGTYRTNVTENGKYVVYTQLEGEEPKAEEGHDHCVVINNQDGQTNLLNYSVSYDLNGGAWQEGEDPGKTSYHLDSTVTATTNIPVRDGYKFVGWTDQKGNPIATGGLVTNQIGEQYTLTAQWHEEIELTIRVSVDHGQLKEGDDAVQLTLFREENGANLPVQELVLNSDHASYRFDEETNTATYEIVIENVEQALYRVAANKSHYNVEIIDEDLQDRFIEVKLTYAPENFDLDFRVQVNATEETKHLMPKAVNVKVTVWDGTAWIPAYQQGGTATPTTVLIDESGSGSGFCSVWKNYPDTVEEPAYYRVEVASFVMPDGSVVPANGKNNQIYTANGSGLYTAYVNVEADADGGSGMLPQYPAAGSLSGAYFDDSDDEQNGIPAVTVDITPFTVTFRAGTGLLNGQKEVVLTGQFAYPDLHLYVPVPDANASDFSCWCYEDGNPAENLSGKYLTGNVVYVAQYGVPAVISGTVTVAGSYEQEGELVVVQDPDRLHEVVVVLQKNINGVLNDVESYKVQIDYNGAKGTGEYSFTIPDDGGEYSLKVLALNYQIGYDNDGDEIFSDTENAVQVGDENTATVHMKMLFVPDSYTQWCLVDASQIEEKFRPAAAQVQVAYRDVGVSQQYQVIAQHKTEQTSGIMIQLDETAKGTGFENIWKWHNNGMRYEYQLQMYKLYGNVPGAYTQEGTLYTEDSPVTVRYGAPTYWMNDGSVPMLSATLVPKEYPIVFNLNADGDTVRGMNEYLMDAEDGGEYYAYMHTWSYTDAITAYPYREGWVFAGWTSDSEDVMVFNHGEIYVGAKTARTVTLTANWIKLNDYDYTIRHLELNTDKVLHGAQAVTGAVTDKVVAAEAALDIEGYDYVGAKFWGTYYDKEQNPTLWISQNPKDNVLVIYYLPDGSDGYTEQVESNLCLEKSAVLENNGTYTVQIETYTKDNPVTTYIKQDTPLDIVMVLDQSSSVVQANYLTDLRTSVANFIAQIAEHGRTYGADHRIAVVGYANGESGSSFSDTSRYPVVGNTKGEWTNTGVFDSNGDFHNYPVTGFNYTLYDGNPDLNDVYYTFNEQDDEYLLLTHHNEYWHLLTEAEARVADVNGQDVYGFVEGFDDDGFVKLTRNSSGLWLYDGSELYSETEFFTYHTDVWTHRKDLERRQIHGYGVGEKYIALDGHDYVYTRSETRESDPQLSLYYDALIPVSTDAFGAGNMSPGLAHIPKQLGANGATYVQYGLEMANRIFEANPLDSAEGRVRIVVMFTDGTPGRGSGTFEEEEANAAIAQASVAKNEYGAHIYTIGLYKYVLDESSQKSQDFFMNAVSSNYQQAQSLEDVRTSDPYTAAKNGSNLGSGGPYFVQVDGEYLQLESTVFPDEEGTNQFGWYYTKNGTNTFVAGPDRQLDNVVYEVVDGKYGDYEIFVKSSDGYKPADSKAYYSSMASESQLQEYFMKTLSELTTKVQQEIVLHNDTIMRDIMGCGLEMTPGTVITAYTQDGAYNDVTKDIDWAVDENGEPVLTELVSLTVGDGTTTKATDEETGVSIIVYNLDAENATNPLEAGYKPHTVDITGYNFAKWYIDGETNPEGKKLIAKITRIEARDNVQWGRSVKTNDETSGLWLPADEFGNRELLLPFDQPTTMFVERAYVLDYGKEFDLTDWFFDDENKGEEGPIHLDLTVDNGMNWFNEEAPNTENAAAGGYGNTRYGNVKLENGQVTYSPVTMNWGGYDQFYVFGDTQSNTVVGQDANANGNLWNKITVIPANNVYYEDSFITGKTTGANSVEGFVFSDTNWSIDYSGSHDSNLEQPERQEKDPYGNVHGWTDDMADDKGYSDGSAHITGINGEIGAEASFTFTGTGVDVYTRTNADSGLIFAFLTEVGDNGDGVTTKKNQIIDNLAVSGDYYQIPTVSFMELPYSTYQVDLVATAVDTATDYMRYEYVLDGIRVYNPLGISQLNADDVVKDAYAAEQNAVFTEVRDVLLDYQDFNVDMDDDPATGLGAVFIDWIQSWQGGEGDTVGEGVPTYQVGTFETYGPKNEVYLSQGQAVVLKVDPNNTYYVGLKTLNTDGDKAAIANISGIDRAEPVAISVGHTADMYYRVTPIDGYIVIENGSSDGSILSVTKLRTTNYTEATAGNGILPVTADEAVEVMVEFRETMEQMANQAPREEAISLREKVAAGIIAAAKEIFGNVRTWLKQA